MRMVMESSPIQINLYLKAISKEIWNMDLVLLHLMIKINNISKVLIDMVRDGTDLEIVNILLKYERKYGGRTMKQLKAIWSFY